MPYTETGLYVIKAIKITNTSNFEFVSCSQLCPHTYGHSVFYMHLGKVPARLPCFARDLKFSEYSTSDRYLIITFLHLLHIRFLSSVEYSTSFPYIHNCIIWVRALHSAWRWLSGRAASPLFDQQLCSFGNSGTQAVLSRLALPRSGMRGSGYTKLNNRYQSILMCTILFAAKFNKSFSFRKWRVRERRTNYSRAC